MSLNAGIDYWLIADYIVVGAGSAGCAVAGRLSEAGQHTVLLLEAGGPDEQPDIHIPACFSNLFHSHVDWDYETIPQPGLNNRREYIPRGKVYGGTSSMNAMVYQRGHPSDYNVWDELGGEGWSYADVLPYFRKMQHQERGESEHHGPINVADPQDPNLLSLAFVEAALELGFQPNADFNDGKQEGFSIYQLTQKDGTRYSAARGYSTAMPFARGTQLLFDGTKCIGRRCRNEGCIKTAHANKEVILCGGALNAPQLLLLSSIGPAEHRPHLTFRS